MKTPLRILAALAAATTFAAAQGSLTPPPGVPGPVMKTLDQVEARTPIPATVTPGPGPHFTINQPGSYYLTGNITVTTGHGIQINAQSDVSIDLNGFTIRSTLMGSTSGNGIHCVNAFARLTVRNGSIVGGSTPPTVQGFQHGIASSGILSEALIQNVHVSGMSNTGMFLDARSIVENCTATNNGTAGIAASAGTVSRSVARSNGGHGIFCPEGSVTDCIASNNKEDGILAIGGIVSGCRSTGNSNDGIDVGVGVAVHCVAVANDPDLVASDYQIKVFAGGQRIGCVPATEAGSP